jgi:glycosidase
LANPQTLDSVTNYEGYKGLYSSLNDANYHEIAYSLNRQFGAGGIYQEIALYNFVDNHDVSRIASQLKNPTHLYPLHILLFTIPGIPSVYYGSEWGIPGEKNLRSDANLRPMLDLNRLISDPPQPNLASVIQRLAIIRQQLGALRFGSYKTIYVSNQQMAFLRQAGDEQVLVLLNSDGKPVALEMDLPFLASKVKDVLNDQETFSLQNGLLEIDLPPTWGRVLVPA